MTEDYRKRFWASLAQARTGLLEVEGGGDDVIAPMTAHFEGCGPLWFYAPADGVLANALGAGARPGRFLYVAPTDALYAVAEAELALEEDAAVKARFWSDEVEAWFPGGPEGPRVAMIRCDLEEAHVWLQTGPAEPHARGRRPRDRHDHVAL